MHAALHIVGRFEVALVVIHWLPGSFAYSLEVLASAGLLSVIPRIRRNRRAGAIEISETIFLGQQRGDESAPTLVHDVWVSRQRSHSPTGELRRGHQAQPI